MSATCIRTKAGRQAGYSLLELMVAATLASGFAIVLSAASGGYLGFLNDLRQRTDNVRSANMIRARMIADAKSSEDAGCSDGTTLLLSSGGGAQQVEYTVSDGNLLRWYSPTDRTVAITDRVEEIACTSLGADGLEVDLALGDEDQRFRLHVHVGKKAGGAGP